MYIQKKKKKKSNSRFKFKRSEYPYYLSIGRNDRTILILYGMKQYFCWTNTKSIKYLSFYLLCIYRIKKKYLKTRKCVNGENKKLIQATEDVPASWYGSTRYHKREISCLNAGLLLLLLFRVYEHNACNNKPSRRRSRCFAKRCCNFFFFPLNTRNVLQRTRSKTPFLSKVYMVTARETYTMSLDGTTKKSN